MGVMKGIFTIDVEEWFQVSGFRPYLPEHRWASCERRLHVGLIPLLDLLDERQVKATCFVVGTLAREMPSVIREIATRGHEIGSHGYQHEVCRHMSPEQFRADVKRSIDVLQEVTGQQVRGFRAPSFSLPTPPEPWLDVLVQLGLTFDASLKGPAWGRPRPVKCPSGTIWELGVSLAPLIPVPFAGGGYLRLFPMTAVRAGMTALHARGIPSIVYVHPWEFDAGQPRIGAHLSRRFKHYVNVGDRHFQKVRRLLQLFPFTTVSEYLGSSPT